MSLTREAKIRYCAQAMQEMMRVYCTANPALGYLDPPHWEECSDEQQQGTIRWVGEALGPGVPALQENSLQSTETPEDVLAIAAALLMAIALKLD